MLKLVLISDTHNKHKQLILPAGDVLVHAGDFSSVGRHHEVEAFLKWFASRDFKYKVLIAGNHDVSFERDLNFKMEMLGKYCFSGSSVFYLEDTGIEIEGFKFYGSPWTPEFYNWAFNLSRKGNAAKKKWSAIPGDTDVLITHGPPEFILDMCQHDHVHYPKNGGCGELRKKIEELEIPLVVFGHIHEGYGMDEHGIYPTCCINASSCTLEYECKNAPVEITLDKDEKGATIVA